MGSRPAEVPAFPVPEQKCEAIPDVKLMHMSEKGLDQETVHQATEEQEELQEKVHEQACEPAPEAHDPSLEAEAPPLRNDSGTKLESVDVNVQPVHDPAPVNDEGSREKEVVEPPRKMEEAAVEKKRESKSKKPAKSTCTPHSAPPEKGISKRTSSPTEKKQDRVKTEDSKSEGGKAIQKDNSSDWDAQLITIPCKDPLVDWRETSKCIAGDLTSAHSYAAYTCKHLSSCENGVRHLDGHAYAYIPTCQTPR